jgi:ribosome-associated translation inhibitor RaiA
VPLAGVDSIVALGGQRLSRTEQVKIVQVHLVTDNHIHGGEHLNAEITSSVEAALDRFSPQLTRVEVHLADENGQKSGEGDKRCTIEARLAGLPPLVAHNNAETLGQAVDGALEKLVAQLDHKLGRLGERKGRASMGDEIAD